MAASAAFADKARLRLDIYAGADGEATLLEDCRGGQSMSTRIRYANVTIRLHVGGAVGRSKPAAKAAIDCRGGLAPGRTASSELSDR